MSAYDYPQLTEEDSCPVDHSEADCPWHRTKHRTPEDIREEQWSHCTPELLMSGVVQCAQTPRRQCSCNPVSGGHDHALSASLT